MHHQLLVCAFLCIINCLSAPSCASSIACLCLPVHHQPLVCAFLCIINRLSVPSCASSTACLCLPMHHQPLVFAFLCIIKLLHCCTETLQGHVLGTCSKMVCPAQCCSLGVMPRNISTARQVIPGPAIQHLAPNTEHSCQSRLLGC